MNGVLLALSALVIVAAAAVWLREAFFAIPACPGGAADCAMRDAHVAGARMIGGVIALAVGYLALWLAMTRRAARSGGSSAGLAMFWILPALIVVVAIGIVA